MEKCFRCGITDEKALLYDAITVEGIDKVCRKCSHKEEVPLMKNKDIEELKEFEKKQDIYDRISRVAGIDNKRKLNQRSLTLEKQDSSLRDLVEKNVCKGINKEAKPREDLVKNFHWIIKRYRRVRHMTQKQLAFKLGEAEKAVILAEQGVIPEGLDFIKKMENVLGVRLIKPEVVEEMNKKEDNELKFDNVSSKVLTIADLQEAKKAKEEPLMQERVAFGDKEDVPEFLSEKELQDQEEMVVQEEVSTISEEPQIEKPNLAGKKDLSKEEMDDLIFGRK